MALASVKTAGKPTKL